MPRLTLHYATIANPKANFLKHSIEFSVSIPLTDDTLKLRNKFELLASEKKSVTLSLESAQLSLFDDAPADDGTDTVTLSANGESVTVSAQGFEHAAEHISDFTRDVLNADESEPHATTRRKTKREIGRSSSAKVERAERKQTKSARKNKK